MKRIITVILTLAILVGMLPMELFGKTLFEHLGGLKANAEENQTEAASNTFTVYYKTSTEHIFQVPYSSGMNVEEGSTFNVLDMDAATDGLAFTCTGSAEVDPYGTVRVPAGAAGQIQIIAKNSNGTEIFRRYFNATPKSGNGLFAGGYGTAERPYLIQNEAQFSAIRNDPAAHYMLISSIQFSNITTIGSFSGVLDGNGYSLYRMRMQQSSIGNLGLFGTNSGTIKNLRCDDFQISNANPDVVGTLYAGLLCGTNTGTLENILIYGGSLNVDVGSGSRNNDCTILAGALCGYNTGTVKKCGMIATNMKAVAVTQYQNAKAYIGGLVGYTEGGSVTDSYAMGVGDGLTIHGESRAGRRTGILGIKCKEHGEPRAFAGGVIGYAQRATVERLLGYDNSIYVEAYRPCDCSGDKARYAGSVIGYLDGSCKGHYSETSDGNLIGTDSTNSTGGGKVADLTASGVLNSLTGFAEAGWVQGSDGLVQPAQNVSVSVTNVKDQALGLPLNLEDAVIQVVDEAGGTTNITGGYKITGYDPNYNGTQTAQITYGNYARGNIRCRTYKTSTVTVHCVDEEGKTLQPANPAEAVKAVKEDSSYTVTAPVVTGYTPETASVSGTMGKEDIAHTIVYTPNSYRVIIDYRYESNGVVAAETYIAARVFGTALTVTAPEVLGYKPMLANGDGAEDCPTITVPADYAGDFIQTVEYTKTDDLLYRLMVNMAGEALPGVEVTFNGKTKTTALDGSVVFNYSPGTETVSLKLQKEGYHGGTYQKTAEYALKTQLGIDYLEMKLDTADNPNYSVQGLTCYGADIEKNYGVINANYDEDILIYVKGNVPEGVKIKKMQLVQDARDRIINDNSETLEGAQKGMIRKVLRTVNYEDAELSKDGFCSFWVKGTEFDHDDTYDTPIYVYMYVENGEAPVIQKLQIDTIKMQFNLEFENLFDNISVDLKGTGIDFLDGMKLSLEMDDKYKLKSPLSFSVQNNQFYVMWDMTDAMEDEVQRQETARNSTVPLSMEKRGQEFVDKVGKAIDRKLESANAKTTADFSMKASIAGGMCFTIHEDGHVTSQSVMKIVISASASWSMDILVVIIPMTFEVSVGAEGVVTLEGLAFDLEEKKILWPSAELAITGKLGLSAGFGCSAASLGVFCNLSAGVEMKIGQECYFDALILNGEAGFYAKLDVGLFELRGEKAWTFLDKRIHLAPEGQVASVAALEPGQDRVYIGEFENLPVYRMSAYELERMVEEEELTTWAVPGAECLADDVPMQADGRIVEHNGQRFVFYYTQMTGRDAVNAKTLVYRIRSGDGWTDPMPVLDDGTSDTEFDAISFGGELYLACIQSNRTISARNSQMQIKDDLSLLNEVVHGQDLYIVKYDEAAGAFRMEQRITNDTHYDSLPAFGVADGTLYLGWNKNTATDDTVTFGTNRNNYVWCTSLVSDSWTDPVCLVNRCYPVTDLQIVSISGKARVAMIVDEDMNLYSDDDRNIYLTDLAGELTYIDCYGSTISNLQTCGSEGILYWLAGDRVMALEDTAAGPYAFSGDNLSVTGDYRIFHLPGYDVTLLVWNTETDDGNQFKASYKMNSGRQWSAPGNLTEQAVPYVVTAWDAAVTGIDAKLVFTNTYIKTPEESGEMELQSRTQQFYKALEIPHKAIVTDKAAQFTEDGHQVKLEITLSNCAPATIGRVDIRLFDRVRRETDGFSGGIGDRVELMGLLESQQAYQTVTTTYGVDGIQISLEPGMSKTVTVYMDAVAGMLLEDYDVKAYIKDYEGMAGVMGGVDTDVPSAGETDTGDTEYEELKPALSVAGEYVIIGQQEFVSLRLENTGDASADGDLVLYRKGDGAEVYREEIKDLMKANAKYYLIRLEKDFFEETAETFLCKIDCFEDADQSDNTVEITARKLPNEPGTQKDLLVQAPELSHRYQTFDKYAPEDVSLEITLNPDIRQYYGCLDVNMDTVDHTVATSGDVKHVTFSKERLQALTVGDYEYRFFFKTDAGYIDALYTLQVVDNTPIPLSGRVELAERTKMGLCDLAGVRRGTVLEVLPKTLNTEAVIYEWLVDGVVVAEGKQFAVTQEYLGKTVQARATGVAPYYGTVISEPVKTEKVERWVDAPVITAQTDRKQVALQKMFNVGDNRLEYGYSTVKDPATVTNWSEETEITLPETGLYYFFAKSSETGIYGEAISEPVAYSSAPVLKFAGASLTLQHNLAINYKVDRAFFDTYGYTDPYVVVEFNGHKTVLREYTVTENQYVFTFRNIAPNQMADVLHATLYAKYRGEAFSSAVRDYSVTQYCYRMLEQYNTDDYAKLKTLLVDLLHYGTAAQVYTGYKTDTPINAELTESQLAWGTAAEPVLASVFDRAYATVENPKVVWTGAGLNLNDSVSMRYKFTADSIENLHMQVQSGGSTWTIPSTAFQWDGEVYYVYFTGLHAGQMRQKIYITMYEGNVPVSNTVCYSIESYAYEKQNSTIAGLAELVKAMMKYGDSAYAYANK